MPKPIPPPPPLPTPEETQAGLVFLRWVILAGACIFFLWTMLYHQDSMLVSYGRNSSIGWNVWKAETLSEEAYRGKENHRIVWLLGSSILRESFDEKSINKRLEEADVQVRVAKFGMDRGAAGLSFALLRKLPIQKGDVIFHGVSPANFRKDWLSTVKIPSYRLMHLFSYGDFWDISEWSLSEKLEQSVVFPYSYWRFHDDFTLGITEYWYAQTQLRAPRKSSSRYFLKFHTFKKKEKKAIKYGKKNFDYFPSEENDFSPYQFNMMGLQKMKRLAKEKGAHVVLVDIQPSNEYDSGVLNQSLRDTWQTWKQENQVLEIPSMPISAYYDLKHPNRIGREATNEILFQWISNERF